MKKNKFILYIITFLLFFNCSPDDSSSDSDLNENCFKLQKMATSLSPVDSYSMFIFNYNIPNEIHIEETSGYYYGAGRKIILKFENKVLKEKQFWSKPNDIDADYTLMSKTIYTIENDKIIEARLYYSGGTSPRLATYSYDEQGKMISHTFYGNSPGVDSHSSTYEWTGNNITKIISYSFYSATGMISGSSTSIIEYDLNKENKVNQVLPYAMFFMEDLYSCHYGGLEHMSENVMKSIFTSGTSGSGLSFEYSEGWNYLYNDDGYIIEIEGVESSNDCLNSKFYWDCH